MLALADVPMELPRCDILIVALPLTLQTRGLIDAQFLAQLPDGAVIVNAGRGAIVDTQALLADLEAGRLRAALDVTDPEPLPTEYPLWSAPNVLITPHLAGSTIGHRDRAWQVAAEQVRRYVNGFQLHHVVPT